MCRVFFPKIIVSFLFLLFARATAFASIVPADGTTLNFTQVMFEYDQVFNATNYRITIQSIDDTDNKDKNIVVNSPSLAILIKEGLQFGHSYQWHYEAYNNAKLLFSSKQFSFKIATSYLIDSDLYRYRVSTNDKDLRQNDILFIENLGVAINRDGIPIWFLPYEKTGTKTEPAYRNIVLNKNGNITYLWNDNCFEKTIYGNTVWKGPNDGQVSGDTSDFYHHDFARLNDGTYVVVGWMYVNEPNPFNPSINCRVCYNVLLQYNAAGKVIWHWTEKGHFSKQTIFEHTTPSSIATDGTHLNSFFYDEKADAFLVSLRNISRIVKIDKKTGNIIYQFGQHLINDTTILNKTDAVFSRQHSAMLLPDNNIMFYNNNADAANKTSISYPHIVMLTQPLNGADAKVVWDYECVTPQYPKGLRAREGYATLLPNNNILVCMGGENRIFEITKNKKTVWECFYEKYTASSDDWEPYPNYRSHFSSSLFPQYFTVSKLSAATAINPNKVFKELTIHNNGTDDDRYNVVVASAKGSIKQQDITVAVKTGLSNNLKIKLQQEKNIAANDELTVTITSVNNPADTKKFSFQLQQ